MKTLFSIIGLLLANYCFAQNIYQIRADTVRIFNNCDTAELVLENRTKDKQGLGTWNLNFTIKNPGGTDFSVLPANTITVLQDINGSWYKIK